MSSERIFNLAIGAFALAFMWVAAGPVFTTMFHNANTSITTAIAAGEDYAASIRRHRALLAEIVEHEERELELQRENIRASAFSNL